MTQQLIECVPNFSEGRDMGVIKQITDAIETVEGVKLLDVDPGKATNRTVVTFVGTPDAVVEAAVLAIGKAGEKADRDRLSIHIGGVQVAENGFVHPGYREAEVVPHMRGQEILIEVDVGVGRGKATVWTCDLTHGYIDINADYRS